MVQSKHGVFLQHSNQLDLSQDVVLYRDDGTTMTDRQRLGRPEERRRGRRRTRRTPKARSARSTRRASR